MLYLRANETVRPSKGPKNFITNSEDKRLGFIIRSKDFQADMLVEI